MPRLFGTDGVRGVANRDLTCSLAHQIGMATAMVLSKKQHKKPMFLIAKDPRLSGDMLTGAITSGLLCAGSDVILLGILPTPAVAHLIRVYQATAGIMISASHNPTEYNGIKLFDHEGFKLSDETEDEIEKLVKNPHLLQSADPLEIGTILPPKNGIRDYINHLKSTVSTDFSGLKIAIDCANGATSKIAETVFSELGAEVFPIANRPDGKNINKNCGSTHLKTICEHTVKSGCDIGISFDGDGDRVLCSDETGTPVDGDQILAILASHMKESGTLKKNTAVCTVMSNYALTLFGENNDILMKQTNVGDRYVLEKMLKSSYNLGGEQSGHIILLDYNTTGDGILTALQVVQILKTKHCKMSRLSGILEKLPQHLINVRVKNEQKASVLLDEEVLELIETITVKLFRTGRVLVRASGTEPLFRIMTEGENPKEIEAYANEIATLIEKKFQS